MPYAAYLCIALVATVAIGAALAAGYAYWRHRADQPGRHRADDATWTRFR